MSMLKPLVLPPAPAKHCDPQHPPVLQPVKNTAQKSALMNSTSNELLGVCPISDCLQFR
jgi:hypothetical protein